MLRKVLKGVVVVVTPVAGVGGYYVSKDEGSMRSFQFWQHIFPVYLRYRYVQLLHRDLKLVSDEEAERRYDHLHERYTDDIRHLVYSMRGFYLKQAQLMSTQDDFVPPAYMRWVKDTQDNVPSQFVDSEARDYVANILMREQGIEFDDVFSSWDDNPLGVASIGEVHKATLRKNGKPVAVKILCPGMENRFRADIRTIKKFCEFAMPQHVTAFNEIEKQFTTEFDYVEEAKNLDRMRDAVLPVWGKYVSIPEPFHDYCSKHLLVMEFLDGIKLVDGVKKQYTHLAALSGQSLDDLEKERSEKIKNGTFVFKSLEDDHKEQEKICNLLAYSDFFQYNAIRMLYNWSPLSWFLGHWEYHRTPIPVDLGRLIEIVSKVHGHQLFALGIFNGDCHPGNIMLLSNGKIGLIDLGQVKRMSLNNRITYAKLILALARDDKKEVIRIHFDEIGVKTKYKKEEIGYLMAAFYNDRDTNDVSKGMSIAAFLDYLEAEDPMIQLSEEFLFSSRMNILLRGMGNAFGIKLRMSKLWESEAREFLKSQGIDC